jgi:hypothetical protein
MELNPLETKTLALKARPHRYAKRCGRGHKSLAQGFNPGLGVLKRCALKGHQIRCDERKLHASILGENRAYSGATFRAHLLGTINPGLKPWAMIFCPFGAVYDPSPRF